MTYKYLPEFDPSLWCNELVLLVLWSASAVLLLLFSLLCRWAAILLLAPPTTPPPWPPPTTPFTPGWWSWSCLHSSVSSRNANSSPGMSCLLHALHLKHSMWYTLVLALITSSVRSKLRLHLSHLVPNNLKHVITNDINTIFFRRIYYTFYNFIYVNDDDKNFNIIILYRSGSVVLNIIVLIYNNYISKNVPYKSLYYIIIYTAVK